MNYDIDNLSNRYDSVGGNALTYDAAGNLTTDKDGYQYEYDYENRIVKIAKDSNDIAEFAYDALGRRIKKRDSVADTNNFYYYNDNWQILCDYNDTGAGGTPERWFAYGNYIDEVVLMSKSFTSWLSARYYIQDHLYSPAALMGATGSAPIERYEYDAYGNCYIMDASYNPRSSSLYGNPYYFTGRQLDFLDGGNLKIQYNRNRYYDYYTGRWLTGDPGEYVDGMNLYEYVTSDPLSNWDPMGMERRDGRRDRRASDRNRRRFWNLSIFDERGKEILWHWLTGDGEVMRREDGEWGDYMMANKLLTPVLRTRLENDALSRSTTGIVNQTFSAEIENGYFTGYEMLHGTNMTVGGFNMKGPAIFTKVAECEYFVDYHIAYTWNDIIDPLPEVYRLDGELAWFLRLFWDAEDYNIHIRWTQKARVKVGCDGSRKTILMRKGYPFGRPYPKVSEEEECDAITY